MSKRKNKAKSNLEIDSVLEFDGFPTEWINPIRQKDYEFQILDDNQFILTNRASGDTCFIHYTWVELKSSLGLGWRMSWGGGRSTYINRLEQLRVLIEDWMWVQEKWDKLQEELGTWLKEVSLTMADCMPLGRPSQPSIEYGIWLAEKPQKKGWWDYPLLWFARARKARPWCTRLYVPGERKVYYGRLHSYKTHENMIKAIGRRIRGR